MTATTPAKPADTRGLAGQSVGDTTICSVNQTQLIYRGYEIADLAAHATFEEVAYLLLVGQKPTPDELAAFTAELVEMRTVHDAVITLVQDIAKTAPDAHPMCVLRTAVSLASHLDGDCEDMSHDGELRKAKRLTAMIPTIIGAHQRALEGKDMVDGDPDTVTRGKPAVLHDGREARRDRRQGHGCLVDPVRRARLQRQYVHEPCHRVDHVGHALGRLRCDWRTQGSIARWCQRGGHGDAR